MSNGQTTTATQTGMGNSGWIWLLALAGVGVGAYMYGQRRGLEMGDENLEAMAEEMVGAQEEANKTVRTAALDTASLTAKLAELARGRAG